MLDDALQHGGVKVANHTEGGLQVLLLITTTVGSLEGNHCGEVRLGIHGKPCEASNKGLVGFPLSNKGLLVFVDRV